MRRIPKPHKITKVIPQVTRFGGFAAFRQQRKALSLFSCIDASSSKLFYFAATLLRRNQRVRDGMHR